MQKQTNTLVADFAVRGTLAYLSHQETLTLFERAFARSGVPMAYSQGFNPHPMISIPLPRAVGVESSVERVCVVIEIPEQTELDKEAFPDFESQLPWDCDILDIAFYPGRKRFIARKVQYNMPVNMTLKLQKHIQTCKNELNSGEPIQIERYLVKKRKKKVVDISRFLERLDVQPGQISVLCRVMQEGTVRVDEIMNWLQLGREQLSSPVKRTLIEWSSN